jgi:hypothetical protein
MAKPVDRGGRDTERMGQGSLVQQWDRCRGRGGLGLNGEGFAGTVTCRGSNQREQGGERLGMNNRCERAEAQRKGTMA